jgi:hypothetical protein
MTAFLRTTLRPVFLGATIIAAGTLLFAPAAVRAQPADAVLAQIEVDYRNWEQYLKSQRSQGLISREDYLRQMEVLQQNIDRRRNVRLAELAELQRQRELQERQTRALEQMANQPRVPMDCVVTDRGAGQATMRCQ